jgi:hypothetical protein
VHAEHAQVQRVVFVDGALAEQRVSRPALGGQFGERGGA